MRLSFLAQDLPHLQFAANKTAKFMSKPCVGGANRLKRVARFLLGHPRWAIVYYEQEKPSKLVVRCDSDWAGDAIDRKSTSSIHVIRGMHLIRSVVSTQAVQALSSGEAEFVASVKAISLALGTKSLFADFGEEMKTIIVETDSSACKGILSRRGLGKIRHLDTSLLWVQGHVANGIVTLKKVKGQTNSADLGTKDLGEKEMRAHLDRIHVEELDGRHPLALSIL